MKPSPSFIAILQMLAAVPAASGASVATKFCLLGIVLGGDGCDKAARLHRLNSRVAIAGHGNVLFAPNELICVKTKR